MVGFELDNLGHKLSNYFFYISELCIYVSD